MVVMTMTRQMSCDCWGRRSFLDGHSQHTNALIVVIQDLIPFAATTNLQQKKKANRYDEHNAETLYKEKILILAYLLATSQ